MAQKDLLLITPPFIQINTVYPATASLKGFLKTKGFNVSQLDLSIACILQIFSTNGLELFFNYAKNKKADFSANSTIIINQSDLYIKHIDSVISFLQGKDQTIAYAIVNNLLPKASRFNIQQDLDWHFGVDGNIDKARFFATLFLEDIADFVTECIDNRFGFSRYAEQVCLTATNFENILQELKRETPITKILLNLLESNLQLYQPKIVAFTIPFPGNLLMAIKSAEYIKNNYPDTKIIFGGGFINTELRNLKEVKLFNFVDYVCLDDGELPLLKLLNYILKGEKLLKRTFLLNNNEVVFKNDSTENDFIFNDIGTPDFEGLPLNDYISVTETTNPMHNLWSNGRWNKMALAHGCYWHKCSFCDTSLDYIKRYDAADVEILCDRIVAIINQTGHRGFHFVDEAAPPALLRKLADEIIKRKISITWWTNIRFENSFNDDLCQLMAKSGCIAVSGGLEVASDRLLKMMNKGVTVEQVVIVTNCFRKTGIMIHAYLMYGFPTESAQETIDSLEIVRQLFVNRLIKSAFWHRFTMTVHSPIGLFPEKFNVTKKTFPINTFAQNGCYHIDELGCKHEEFEIGLNTALYNYIHDNGFEFHLQDWFDFKIPNTTIPNNYIKKVIRNNKERKYKVK